MMHIFAFDKDCIRVHLCCDRIIVLLLGITYTFCQIAKKTFKMNKITCLAMKDRFEFIKSQTYHFAFS